MRAVEQLVMSGDVVRDDDDRLRAMRDARRKRQIRSARVRAALAGTDGVDREEAVGEDEKEEENADRKRCAT
jgi:hypothetical protein